MRDVDPYELFVRWYLRFNGYLSVENYVVHEPIKGGIRQGGETDILAVRFPYSCELPGFAIENDRKLLDEDATRDGLVDFVVAEVKAGQTYSLNRVWEPPADDQKIDRVTYLLRWLGPLADKKLIRNVATELQASHRARHSKLLFRLVIFAHKVQPKRGTRQVTFHDVAQFLVNVRAPSWQNHGLGSRSPHDQWHSLVKKVWRIADPAAPHDAECKIQAILHLLQEERTRLVS